MFEFLVEKETEARKLSEAEASRVAADVGDLWKDWDEARSKQKAIAEKLRPEIYLDDRPAKDRGEGNWKSDVHLNKIYSLSQTQQAFIWDNIYSNNEKLFDVAGKDDDSGELASLQKANLVNIFYQIGIQRKLDRAIEYLLSVGEFCLFIGWKTKYRQIRRRMTLAEALQQKGLEALFAGQNYGIFNEEVYNGPSVEPIDPMNLTFDPKINPEDSEKWDECGKIVKEWLTYDEIASNKFYKLSRQQLSDIKTMLDKKSVEEDDTETEKTDDVLQENRIEVLSYWGNYTLDDGTVLRNWSIVVVGRKYLAVFEHNRFIVNPLVNMAVFRDYESKRGIPEIWSIYDIAKEQENKVNLQNDAQALNLNPPAYAPQGFFIKDEIKLAPGKQIEYKPGLDDPSALIKMQFPLISNEQIIEYYDSTASTVSGIFPNMQGQDEAKDATATEIQVKVQGQTTRLAKTLDAIKQNGIVPMVEKVAALDANMKFGNEVVYVENDGMKTAVVIGDTVRQGNYEYRYTDNTGIARKLAKNQELIQLLGNVWNDQAVPLNKVEIVKDILANAEFENVDKYFLTQNTAMLPQLAGNAQPLPVAGLETQEVTNGQANGIDTLA